MTLLLWKQHPHSAQLDCDIVSKCILVVLNSLNSGHIMTPTVNSLDSEYLLKASPQPYLHHVMTPTALPHLLRIFQLGDRWGLFFSGASGDGMWACCCCSAFSLKFPHGECVSQLSALSGPFTVHTASCTASAWAEAPSLRERFLGVCVCVCMSVCVCALTLVCSSSASAAWEFYLNP